MTKATDDVGVTGGGGVQQSNVTPSYFTVSGQSDDEEESVSEEDDKLEHSSMANSQAERLPNPLAAPKPQKMVGSGQISLPKPSLKGDIFNAEHPASVYTNPFQIAEKAKLSVLEKHVKLTSSEEKAKAVGKKNVCKNFKQGRCRFGHKCKYAHDSDIIAAAEEKGTLHANYGPSAEECLFEEDAVDDDSYISQKKRKFRSGVSDNLKPPKRAMQVLDKQRTIERPWTMSNK